MRRGLNKFVGRDAELQRMRRPLQIRSSRPGTNRRSSRGGPAPASRGCSSSTTRPLPLECRVLEAHWMLHSRATAWLPVIELLYAYFGIASTDDAAQRREVSASLSALDSWLGDLLPYVLGLLGVIEGPDPLQNVDSRIKRERRRSTRSGKSSSPKASSSRSS